MPGRLRPLCSTREGSLEVARGLLYRAATPMKIDETAVGELESLKQLESRIGKILDRHEEVRREKDALARQLLEREAKFDELVKRVHQFEQERRELKGRLEKILSRLNGLDIA